MDDQDLLVGLTNSKETSVAKERKSKKIKCNILNEGLGYNLYSTNNLLIQTLGPLSSLSMYGPAPEHLVSQPSPCSSKNGPQDSSTSIAREFIRNADSQVPSTPTASESVFYKMPW